MILISKFTVPIGWTVILRRTCRQIYRGQCFGWAAALAYYSFLALFPALLFVVSVASFLPLQHLIDRAVDLVGRFAPDDVVAIARQQLLQIADKPHGSLLAFSLVGTIWSMSSGMVALSGTLNQAHHISEGRSWWRVRATAIALTVTLTLVMVLSFTLAMVGPTAAEHVADWLDLGAVFTMAWQIVRWPAAFAFAVTAIASVYHFAPDVKREFVWITPGSVAATALWLVISLGFKWYVFQFGNYQQTYGAIGGVMVTLLWFYFSGLSILLGAQLNATIDHASQPLQAEALKVASSPQVPSWRPSRAWGAGGAVGGTAGAFIGLGIPEYQAKRYEGRMRKGGILLSVHADNQEWASKGQQILEQTGAEDISSIGETKGDFGNTDRPTGRVEHDAPVEVVKH